MAALNHSIAFAESQNNVVNTANPRRALNYGVEYRLHVSGRTADDAEHLGRCRLMLQCLAQFRVTFPEFLEQPHVLNGDHRLVGEGFEESDLLLSERIDYRTANKNGPNRNLFAQEWYGKYGSITFSFGDSPDLRKLHRRYGQHILYVDYLTVDHRPPTR